MNQFVLRNLRKRFGGTSQELSEEGETIDEVASLIPINKGTVINININKFEKPVGAIVQTGGTQDIKDIIEIKKEE
jgi:hypothetical protein